MRLLFITQVLDRQDAVLGFVPRWVDSFAKQVERVRVIALSIGDLSGLGSNVDVRVVGRKGTLRRYLRYRSFLREAFVKDGFDTVLAHMIPRYSSVAAGPARRAGARHFLWYTHGAVDHRLRKAERVVESIFTASEESMRLDTPKKVVTGHGIDLEHFDARGTVPLGAPRLLSVGRMTPSKDPLTLIEALALLVAEGRDVNLDIVGGGLAAGDSEYEVGVRRRIDELALNKRVVMHQSVPYLRIPDYFRRASVCVNSSFTGNSPTETLVASNGRSIGSYYYNVIRTNNTVTIVGTGTVGSASNTKNQISDVQTVSYNIAVGGSGSGSGCGRLRPRSSLLLRRSARRLLRRWLPPVPFRRSPWSSPPLLR